MRIELTQVYAPPMIVSYVFLSLTVKDGRPTDNGKSVKVIK